MEATENFSPLSVKLRTGLRAATKDNRGSNTLKLSTRFFTSLEFTFIYVVQKKIRQRIDFSLNTVFLLLKLIFEFGKNLWDKLRLDYPRGDHSVQCSITLKT